MTNLLDVNVIVSLLDANHEHHAASTEWFSQSEAPWASCPTTQNGFLRTVTRGYGSAVSKGYGNAISIQQAFHKLSQAISTTLHEFIPDNLSLLDNTIVEQKHIQGHKQLTDIYLLALSVAHGARFITLDKRISINTVLQATDESMLVILP